MELNYLRIKKIKLFLMASDRFNLESKDQGSALPLLIGVMLLGLSAYIMATNIYSLSTSKMKLESWGEDFIGGLYKEISYQDYFFGSTEDPKAGARSFVTIDCSNLLLQLKKNLGQVPSVISFVSTSCAGGRIKVVLTKKVRLPFSPPGAVNFEPRVIAHVEAGLQRVQNER